MVFLIGVNHFGKACVLAGGRFTCDDLREAFDDLLVLQEPQGKNNEREIEDPLGRNSSCIFNSCVLVQKVEAKIQYFGSPTGPSRSPEDVLTMESWMRSTNSLFKLRCIVSSSQEAPVNERRPSREGRACYQMFEMGAQHRHSGPQKAACQVVRRTSKDSCRFASGFIGPFPNW
jgi:hypothetical protein